MTTTRPPLPPFTRESAIQKVRLAEDGWNTRDPGKVALAYAIDSRWRNRSEFVNGRDEITAFLWRKWARELDYRLIKELWAFTGNRIAASWVSNARRILIQSYAKKLSGKYSHATINGARYSKLIRLIMESTT
jgi:nuclear transport factor 2 (NTF2) superfamily protein